MSIPVKIALWLFAISLLWIGAASGQGGPDEVPSQSPSPTSCWSQYQTEHEAILNCEDHND